MLTNINLHDLAQLYILFNNTHLCSYFDVVTVRSIKTDVTSTLQIKRLS